MAEGTSTLHLAIRSPFGLTRYLTPHTALRPDGFFESGDLVVASRDGTLRSAGRV